ncbi:MAG TPA: hypothetical protein VHX38_02950 [Pseudonocardiaceae bacterium]|jgi:hypothetical protein|nr:hypothetical protein [Pseudonocardiaceae bacterium]
MADFLIKRGKAAVHRKVKAHVAHYDAHGQVDRARCGRTDFTLRSNVPWGLRVCKSCLSTASR